MTITKALRKLYKVIVGEEAPANANTITKVLLALAEAWTGGGGSGGSGGGGTEPLIVKSSGGTLDHTWQEIYDAPIAYLHLESYGLAGLPARLSLIDIGQSRSPEAGNVLYYVSFGSDPTMRYNADSDDGYPQEDED